MQRRRNHLAFWLQPFWLSRPAGAQEQDDGERFRHLFATEVTLRLAVPWEEQERYAAMIPAMPGGRPQYVAVIDRNPNVQAIFLIRLEPGGGYRWIGASPVSTGLPGRFEYFRTPLGVFPHVLANHDYRAMGTRNKYGIRGYGRKGLRVYDLGWVRAKKGWGNRKESVMRLQMHSTDPDILEPYLGTPRSKGCIRIHASLNVFFDRYGILDADYRRAVEEGPRPWVLLPEWVPAPAAGQYLVVVDTERTERPEWSPAPDPVR